MPFIDGQWRPVLTLPIPSQASTLVNFNRASLLFGYSFIETSGNGSASFDILDGNDANGALVSPIALDPGQSRSDWFGGTGIFLQSGPFLKVINGSFRGALFYIDVTAAQLLAIQSSAQ